MSFDCYMKGELNGGTKFAGTCGQDIAPLQVKAGEHTRIFSVEYGVNAVLDPTNGQPANKRFHDPFTVMFEHDANVPLYFQALVTGESIKMVEFTFGQVAQVNQTKQGDTATKAGEQIAMKITLTNAHIKELKFATGLSADKHGSSSSGTSTQRTAVYDTQELVVVSFIAQKYHIIRPSDGNKQWTDDWSKGMVAK